MDNCIRNCQICPNLVFSTAVTVVTVDGVATLVVDIPAASYSNGRKICLIITQAIPDTATITMPVAISIGGDTTTVYPLVACNCIQATACAIRTRKRYPLRVATNATSAVFVSLGGLSCAPNTVLASIPVTVAATSGSGTADTTE